MSNGTAVVSELRGATLDEIKASTTKAEQDIAEFQKRRRQRPAPQTPPAPEPVTDGQPPPSQDPAPVQPEPAAPAETDAEKATRLESEVRDLKHQVDVANGKFGGTVQALKAQIVDLQQVLSEMKATRTAPTPAEPPVAPAEPAGTPWLDGVPQESIDKYGEAFFENAWRASRTQFEALKADLQKTAQRSQQAEDRLGALEKRVTVDLLHAKIDRLCPGAMALNGDPATGIPCNAAWSAFLDKPVRDGGTRTRRQDAQEAYDAANAEEYVSIVKEFMATQKQKATPPRPDVRAEVTPASVRGTTPPTTGKRKIPQSEVTAWAAKCAKATHGEIPLEEVNRRTQEYMEARKEGRIYPD